MTRILVTGSRDWTDRELLFKTLDDVVERITLDALRCGKAVSAATAILLVHGAARGADTIAAEWAALRYYAVEPHPADWGRYGKKQAGAIRNSAMVALGASFCVAFPMVGPPYPNKSGTSDCYTKAIRAGIPTLVVPGRSA